MNPTITAFIESGVLELYAMGAANPEETAAVEEMATAHPEIRHELDSISQSLEQYALAHTVKPRNVVKPLLLATIDYMERMKHGELPASPPIMTANARPEDYAAWLHRPDMVLPPDADDIFAKIIGNTPAAITAIVWIKEAADQEVHHDEQERFLIIEGTCEIIAGDKVTSLAAGDFYEVPLHMPHMFKVTSAGRCKAILQRVRVAA